MPQDRKALQDQQAHQAAQLAPLVLLVLQVHKVLEELGQLVLQALEVPQEYQVPADQVQEVLVQLVRQVPQV